MIPQAGMPMLKNERLYAMLFILVFLSCSVGAVCGFGGGVVIKPVLDFVQYDAPQVVNFLSGCTVLSMSLYTVGASFIRKEKSVKTAVSTPLAVGAIAGGLLGKEIFSYLLAHARQPGIVSSVQALVLIVLTACCLLYLVCKKRIHPLHTDSKLTAIGIGVFLGTVSGFLGIGGGQFNLIVLYFFFGMDTKTAANNSLYIILLSKISNLLLQIFTHSVPDFALSSLLVMIAAGVFGGIIGRFVNKRVSDTVVDRLLTAVLCAVMLICAHNAAVGFVV